MMPDVTRVEFESLAEDMRDVKDLCLKTYRKLFETNGGPSVLDRLSHMEETQQKSDDIRKWRRGICAIVIASLTVQAIGGIVTLAPIVLRMLRHE
jgi:hypothetical protein